MQSSEEVSQINSALSHCNQLKRQLQGTILHIQKLSTKYNQTDYMAVIHNLENYRKSSSLTSSASPYPKKIRQRDQSIHNESGFDDDSFGINHSPVKRRPSQFRRMQMANNSTPKRSRVSSLMMDDSMDSCPSDVDTPKRSMREMKTNNNTISVRTIKVHRNIEAILTQLQVLQRSEKKRQRQQMEQSLYQSCCNSSIGSPGLMGHSRCMDASSSFITACGSIESLNNHSGAYYTPKKIGRHDDGQKTLDRVQRFYATPLQRMHKRLIHLNASLVSTC